MTLYTRKSSAMIGAKRAGLTNFEVKQTEAGQWTFVDLSVEAKTTYKVLAVKGAHKSLVAKPVNRVHAWLNNHENLGRKEAIAQLVEQGVNFYTARTQYQTWFKSRVAA